MMNSQYEQYRPNDEPQFVDNRNILSTTKTQYNDEPLNALYSA